jgi:hypothetical protein
MSHILIGNILFILSLFNKTKLIKIYENDQKIINAYKKQKNNEVAIEEIPVSSKINNLSFSNFLLFYVSFIFITWFLFISRHISAIIIKKFFLK